MADSNVSTPGYMRLLPDRTIGMLGRLNVDAVGMVEGFISGRHRSPHKGFSVEFAEHRPYVPGDDLRNLDWRILARKDRSYIKQYVEETNLRATILVDASGSMGYCGRHAASVAGQPASKFDYARYVAAALAYILIGQQDATGVLTFDTRSRDYLPPRSRPSQIRRILETLDRTEPGGETGVADVFHDIAERIPPRGLVIILSDLFDDATAMLRALQHFRHRRHEVIVMHIMAEEELTFPFDRFIHFKDMESATRELAIDPRAIRAGYLERVREFLHAIRIGCGQMRVEYVPVNTRTSYEHALSSFLSARHRKGR